MSDVPPGKKCRSDTGCENDATQAFRLRGKGAQAGATFVVYMCSEHAPAFAERLIAAQAHANAKGAGPS